MSSGSLRYFGSLTRRDHRPQLISCAGIRAEQVAHPARLPSASDRATRHRRRACSNTGMRVVQPWRRARSGSVVIRNSRRAVGLAAGASDSHKPREEEGRAVLQAEPEGTCRSRWCATRNSRRSPPPAALAQGSFAGTWAARSPSRARALIGPARSSDSGPRRQQTPVETAPSAARACGRIWRRISPAAGQML